MTLDAIRARLQADTPEASDYYFLPVTLDEVRLLLDVAEAAKYLKSRIGTPAPAFESTFRPLYEALARLDAERSDAGQDTA